ncbi:MAG: hypothetical protein ROO73_05825 [Roseivirga sp.]
MAIHRQRLGTLLVLYLSLLWLPTHAHAARKQRRAAQKEKQEHYFLFDRYMSPCAAASLFISGRAMLSEVEDHWFSDRSKYTVWGRIGSSVANAISNNLLANVNHEVFGHGFRLRSLKQPVLEYSFTLLGGAATFFEPFQGAPVDREVLVNIGGIETNSVFAQAMLLQGFKQRTWGGRTYELFYNTCFDLPKYILSTSLSKESRNMPGNDIVKYIEGINAKHHSDEMKLDMLENAAVIFLLNPILYVSWWSYWGYLFTGQDAYTIPHLDFNNVAYMPIIRAGLTPFGLMYYLDNYIGYNNKTFLVSLEGGKSPFYSNGYGGVQVKTHQLWHYKNYGLDVEGHLWCQPSLQLETHGPVEDKNHWGGLVGLSNQLQLTEMFSLNAAVLYKTLGFAEGVVADKGLVFRGGFTLCY